MKNNLNRIAMAGAAFLGVAGLSACSNVEPVDQYAAQINPDGDVEIYDAKSKQVIYTTDTRLVEQSDRKEFIAEQKAQGIDTSTLSGNEGDTILRGVVVNDRGYTNSLYCDEEEHQCDVGDRSYRLLDEQVKTKPIDPKGFDIF